MFRIRKTAAALVVTTGALLTFVGPASAHDDPHPIWQGLDEAFLEDNHRTVAVNDNECDGHAVFVQAWRVNGVRHTYWNDNGCAWGPDTFYGIYGVKSYRVCESVPNAPDYCSPWEYVL